MTLQESTFDQDSLIHQSFRLADNVLFRQVENEAVLLHVSSGTYYSLSETSILFWQAIENQASLMSVVDKILAEYEVEKAQVLAELQILLQTLLENELIFIASS